MPTAAVLTGAAGLLVPPPAEADPAVALAASVPEPLLAPVAAVPVADPVAVISLLMLLTRALTELVSVSSTPLMLLASAPVAVASTALSELARDPTSLVRLPTSDVSSPPWLDTWAARLDTAAVAVASSELSDVAAPTTLPASDVALPAALDASSTIELASSDAVCSTSPGLASLVSTWAVASEKSWA